MIRFPRTPAQAAACPGEFRAGGTDLMERRDSGVSGGDLVDLRDLDGEGLRELAARGDGGLRLGALLTLRRLAEDPAVRAAAPALASAAAGTATAQVREVGTLGGNLMQRVRCWYFRHPDVPCLKKGGGLCFARAGDPSRHAVIELGPCIAPHPSTLGLALLAYDATLVFDGGVRDMETFFGDGADPRRENSVDGRELLLRAELPAPWPGERSAYVRATQRAGSEWPMVDAVARFRTKGGRIADSRVTLGHAANRSLRLREVEEVLRGGQPGEALFARAGEAAIEGRGAPPVLRYKLHLIRGVVQEALERAAAAPPSPSGAEPDGPGSGQEAP